jgi:hypothetical protein
VNFSIIAIFLIYVYDWSRGIEIDIARSFSLFSIIFTLYNLVNTGMYYSLTATFQYLAILKRLSDILMMEDVKKSRMNEDVKPSDVCIEL